LISAIQKKLTLSEFIQVVSETLQDERTSAETSNSIKIWHLRCLSESSENFNLDTIFDSISVDPFPMDEEYSALHIISSLHEYKDPTIESLTWKISPAHEPFFEKKYTKSLLFSALEASSVIPSKLSLEKISCLIDKFNLTAKEAGEKQSSLARHVQTMITYEELREKVGNVSLNEVLRSLRMFLPGDYKRMIDDNHAQIN
jgi:hypothetical protein